ncbi:hypothetical protein [Phaeobacter piscinae]|uniref:hypothetical protein n=1 Tax=Phaeobacter piscinae TaxID=1580596 RepID=UPI000C9AEEB5|nr:hypothetical protein [Phaeobacter piscinae]AUQ73212.1 hypothetical protein PhaeoP71_00314 [Phaeobacter piscinae]
MTYRKRSLLGEAKPGSRGAQIKKRLLICAVAAGTVATGFFLIGFIRFGSLSLYLAIGLLVATELLRGMGYLLRVFSLWVPGLTIWYARYEGWMDERVRS